MALPLIFKTNKTMAIRKQTGPGPKKNVVKSKGPSVGSGNPFTGARKKEDTSSTTYKRNKAAGEGLYMANYLSQHVPQTKANMMGNLTYDMKPASGVAKKPNTTKAPAAGTASKKDVKSYKKTMRKK